MSELSRMAQNPQNIKNQTLAAKGVCMVVQIDAGLTSFEPDESRRLYDNATDYHYSSFVLNEIQVLKCSTSISGATTMPYQLPAIMISSFSVELYMKCLLAICKIECPKEHKLNKPFSLLPDSTQAEITANYSMPSEDDDIQKPIIAGTTDSNEYYTLTTVLARLNNSFVDWRYVHENGKSLEFSGVEPLRNAIVNCILNLKPEWPSILKRHGRPPTFLIH